MGVNSQWAVICMNIVYIRDIRERIIVPGCHWFLLGDENENMPASHEREEYKRINEIKIESSLK
jgi:hypothetical protein